MILPGFFLCSVRRKKERRKMEEKEADDGLDALPIWVGLGLLITIEVSSPAFISSNAVTGINGKQYYYGPDGISLAERYILCYSGINGYNTEISLEFFLS